MNVPSIEFLGFAAIVAITVNIAKAPAWRSLAMLVANVCFIATFVRHPAQIMPFMGMLAIGYAGMKLVERKKNKVLFATTVVVLLGMFCWLKGYSFMPHAAWLPEAYVTVGMSYVFFRLMHLVIDAYQDALPAPVKLVSFLNYSLNFTCLVAGPIQFYRDFAPSETNDAPDVDINSLGNSIERIIVGLMKVFIIFPIGMHFFNAGVSSVTSTADGSGVLPTLIAVGLFPLCLYVNFSGYCDVVIAVGRMCRIHLPENFNKPFAAQGFIELWNRWHMTLSNWLKTYVFSPFLLELMRKFPSREVEPWLGVCAFFVTFFLVGAWHGQTSMFLTFGVLTGLGVSVNKLYQILMIRRLGKKEYKKLCEGSFYVACSRSLTYVYFAFTLVWFWSTSDQLKLIAMHLGVVNVFVMLAALLAVTVSVYLSYWWLRSTRVLAQLGAILRSSWYVRPALISLLLVILISAAAVFNAPAPQIMYKGF